MASTTRAPPPDDDLRLLQAQVAQWRDHGKRLSEAVRELQAELDQEREANGHMRRLLTAQEEKIALLEQLVSAPSGSVIGQGGQHHSHLAVPAHVGVGSPVPAEQQPKPQSHLKWLPRWLTPGGHTDQAGTAEPPPWARWMAGPNQSTESHQPPPPPSHQPPSPRQQEPPERAADDATALPTRCSGAAPVSSGGPMGEAAPLTPPPPPGRGSGTLAHCGVDEDADTLEMSDWAGVHTAARRLHDSRLAAGDGTGAREVESFLEAFLSAVSPGSPLPVMRPRPPPSPLTTGLQGGHLDGGGGGLSSGDGVGVGVGGARGGASVGCACDAVLSAGAAGGGRLSVTQGSRLLSGAVPGMSVSSGIVSAGGADGVGGTFHLPMGEASAGAEVSTPLPRDSAAHTAEAAGYDLSASSCAARRGMCVAPFVVGLGAAQGDRVTHEPSPPVTTRCRPATGSEGRGATRARGKTSSLSSASQTSHEASGASQGEASQEEASQGEASQGDEDDESEHCRAADLREHVSMGGSPNAMLEPGSA